MTYRADRPPQTLRRSLCPAEDADHQRRPAARRRHAVGARTDGALRGRAPGDPRGDAGACSNMGLVAISHGERAKVLQLTAQSIFRQVDVAAQDHARRPRSNSLEHLKSARIFFERGMVREAAAEGDRRRMSRRCARLLDEQRGCLGDAEAFIAADMGFHTQIAGDLRQSDLSSRSARRCSAG